MTRLLFVDHALHRATASSAFFTDMLRERFEVSCLYVQPDSHHTFDWPFVATFDLVVLWQVDYLAPLFLARGHRTVVIPMYDGSAALPQVHWACADGARFVNFSRTLHERVRLLGLDSLSVKYFCAPVAEAQLPSFDGLRVFLWQRRPEDGITSDLVARLFGSQLRSLHVHNVPDNPTMAARFAPPSSIGDAPVTVSEWFADRAQYLRVLEGCNVFVCPRSAEGIGMAMVEALARGMLVVANDLPCHNEYICNWLNGVLFHTSHVGYADFTNVVPIARMGWRTARDGHARWLASIPAILDFVAATPRFRPAAPRVVADLQRNLLPAYQAGGEIYERFLLKLLPALLHRERVADDAAPLRAPGRARSAADRAQLPVSIVPTREAESASVAISFANGAARPLLRSGWSVDEAFGVWIEGGQAELAFAAAFDFPVAALTLTMQALAPGDVTHHTGLSVVVNGVASSQPVPVYGGGARPVSCQIVPPAPITARSWQLEFCCDRTLGASGDSRRLSVALMGLTIAFLPVAPTATPEPAAEPDDTLVAAPLAPLAAPRRTRAALREDRLAPAGAAVARDAEEGKVKRSRPLPGSVVQSRGGGLRGGARERLAEREEL